MKEVSRRVLFPTSAREYRDQEVHTPFEGFLRWLSSGIKRTCGNTRQSLISQDILYFLNNIKTSWVVILYARWEIGIFPLVNRSAAGTGIIAAIVLLWLFANESFEIKVQSTVSSPKITHNSDLIYCNVEGWEPAPAYVTVHQSSLVDEFLFPPLLRHWLSRLDFWPPQAFTRSLLRSPPCLLREDFVL